MELNNLTLVCKLTDSKLQEWSKLFNEIALTDIIQENDSEINSFEIKTYFNTAVDQNIYDIVTPGIGVNKVVNIFCQ